MRRRPPSSTRTAPLFPSTTLFRSAIETYEWAAAQVEALGGEAARLRPRLVIAMFRQWTARELDLRREAASASELAESLQAELGFTVPAIDWTRTSRRVMTLEWIEIGSASWRERVCQ